MIKGGLGNQMFCYAAGRAFALRTGRELLLDTRTGFRRDTYQRSYRLDRLPIQATEAPAALRLGDDHKCLRHKFARAINRLLPPDRRSYVLEDPDVPTTQLTTLEPTRPHLYLNGYWQKEDYFSDHAAAIRTELTPPAPDDQRNRETAAEIGQTEAVFLHVRRVRYPRRLDAAYYRRAIEHIREQVDAPHFFLFGDDLDWPREQFDLDPAGFTVVDHNTEDEIADLSLMSRCRHGILANSSFSWWGGWLIDNPEKVICTPQNPGWPVRPATGWTPIENQLEN